MIEPNIITDPTTEAISETELKQQVSATATDDLSQVNLTIYRKAARRYYEDRTGRTLHETELELILNAFPGDDFVELPRATPLISITSVKYVESDGTAQTFGAANYIADIWNQPGRVALAYGESWPSFTAYPTAPVRIRYKAGIETDSPIVEADDADKLPILLLAAHLYENREAVNLSDRGSIAQVAVQYGIEAFINLRIVRHHFQHAR